MLLLLLLTVGCCLMFGAPCGCVLLVLLLVLLRLLWVLGVAGFVGQPLLFECSAQRGSRRRGRDSSEQSPLNRPIEAINERKQSPRHSSGSHRVCASTVPGSAALGPLHLRCAALSTTTASATALLLLAFRDELTLNA